jgi:putative membrane protein
LNGPVSKPDEEVMKREILQLESIQPDTFVSTAALECMTEMQLGQMALTQAITEAVRGFGRHVIADHGKTLAEVTAIAARKGIPVPTSLDDYHDRVVRQMREKGESDFDSAFAAYMVDAYTKSVLLYKRGQRIKNPDISALASRALIRLEARKRMTNSLLENIAPQDWPVLVSDRTEYSQGQPHESRN